MMVGRGVIAAGGLARHVPVMLPDVLEAVAPRSGQTIVDGTFGGGGYSRALLEAANCTVYGIDRDRDAIAAGASLERQFAPRLSLLEGRFSQMQALLGARGIAQVDAVVLDIGVSSRQLGEPARGFSFQADGPLDMRMGPSGMTAADVVNQLSEADLSRIIATLGEERRARAIARAIVHARANEPIETTGELARIVAGAVGHMSGSAGSRIHPATRTFQALRIVVNDELGELARGLTAAEELLKEGGRLVVVSFHSLEDRVVKRFMAERAGNVGQPSRHQPETIAAFLPSLRVVGRSVRRPRAHEIETNPRARSAKLRVAERTGAPFWPEDLAPDKLETLGVPDIGDPLGGLK
ncbi:MAG: 16S rRNA (cytosine(1402)-N(4))-methyltransferase RsmH [Rhizobiales bacterium]|nr:16S rRNA (cytosine(1402)-N(4))-methyltransferase RsmH [Hyphomicrobiales bacterium]